MAAAGEEQAKTAGVHSPSPVSTGLGMSRPGHSLTISLPRVAREAAGDWLMRSHRPPDCVHHMSKLWAVAVAHARALLMTRCLSVNYSFSSYKKIYFLPPKI
jgi:hypothetical protein